MVDGMTFTQSPACGKVEEKARALEHTSQAESRSLLKDASSIEWERARCHRGTSTSSRETQSGLAADSASRVSTAATVGVWMPEGVPQDLGNHEFRLLQGANVSSWSM